MDLSLEDNIFSKSIYFFRIGDLRIWEAAASIDDQLFQKLLDLTASTEPLLAWRSAWILDLLLERNPEWIKNRLHLLLIPLLTTENSSLQRHLTRILTRHEVPEVFLAKLIDRCLVLIETSKAVAVRVNSLQLLYNISLQVPEFKSELTLVIESYRLKGGSAGLINRLENISRKLLIHKQAEEGTREDTPNSN